jgi:DNA-binding NarL/FixJ family response regulator
MSAHVQVISSHAVFAAAVAAALAHDSFLRRRVSVGVGSAVDPAKYRQPALFVIDLCCPGPQPSALCRLLRGKYPVCKFVCLISPEQAREDFMLGLFFAGVEGIVCLRQRWGSELRRAARNVLGGQLCIPAIVLRKFAAETGGVLQANNGLNKMLTAREIQIAHLTLRQFSTIAIAGELGISKRTVKFHLANIFLKTGVRNRSQLNSIVCGPHFPFAGSSRHS